jgi:hypothetical protein
MGQGVNRQVNYKACAHRLVAKLDPAAMGLSDAAGYGEPQAGA